MKFQIDKNYKPNKTAKIKSNYKPAQKNNINQVNKINKTNGNKANNLKLTIK